MPKGGRVTDPRTLSRCCVFDGVRYERLRKSLLRCQAVQKITINNRTISLQWISPTETRVTYFDGYTGAETTEHISDIYTARQRFLASLTRATMMYAILGRDVRHIATYPTKALAEAALPQYQAMLPDEPLKVKYFRVLQRY